MTERLLQLLLDESHWLPAAMLLAGLAAAAWSHRMRRAASARGVILGAMNLFYGVMIGTMGSGHLLAVAVAHGRGTLAGSAWLLYPLGLVLALPAWTLVCLAGRIAEGEPRARRGAAALDAWLGLVLLAFGLHNFPLAAPAALNLAYQLHTRRAVGWAIVTVAVAANLALFVGSLVFLASGRSFEEFSGM